MGNNEQITETVETAAITLEELAQKVAELDGKLAKAANVAKKGSLGFAAGIGAGIGVFLLIRKLRKAKKAKADAAAAEDGTDA